MVGGDPLCLWCYARARGAGMLPVRVSLHGQQTNLFFLSHSGQGDHCTIPSTLLFFPSAVGKK